MMKHIIHVICHHKLFKLSAVNHETSSILTVISDKVVHKNRFLFLEMEKTWFSLFQNCNFFYLLEKIE